VKSWLLAGSGREWDRCKIRFLGISGGSDCLYIAVLECMHHRRCHAA
jgi:hypothetical protein